MASFVHLIDQRRLIGPGGSTVSGEIFFYYTGTTVKAPIYTDAALLTPAANPVVVGAGQIIPIIFLNDTIEYRRVIVYSDGSQDQQDPVQASVSDGEFGIPIGGVIDFSGAAAPDGFVFCFGQELSRTDYADLFAVINTTYGPGNGTTTFSVPDYRGRVGAGKDNMGGTAASRLTVPVSGSVLGAVGGFQTHTLLSTEMPAHSHPVTDPGHAHQQRRDDNSGASPNAGGNPDATYGSLEYGVTSTSTTGVSVGSTGGGSAHNNVQPTIVTNKIIKTKATSFLSMLGVDLAAEVAPALEAIQDAGDEQVALVEAAGAEQIAEAQAILDILNAIALGIYYDTTAEGIAATVNGEFFGVIDEGRIYIYLNDGGVAVEATELATRAMLDALASGVADGVLAQVLDVLEASDGSASVGFIHNLVGALARTVQSKLRDTVSPEDFGAVGDGATDDTVAITNAINSGRMVDANGRTYALGSPVVPGGNVKGIRNANFKWANTTVMAQQQFMLSIIDKSNIVLDNLTFDLGTVENCGSANDSTRGGLKVSTLNEGVTYNDYLNIRNIRAFGKGNGTGVYIRSFRFSTIDGITVHDREVSASPDPTNDCQNGADISIGYYSTISNIVSRDQTTRLSGTLQKRFSRGVLHFELVGCALTNYAIADVDQGLDLSGAITATLTQGNSNLSLSSMSATGCNTYGFKFANCTHDVAASGLVASDFGFVGFVFSSPTTTPLDATKNTQMIVLSGCHALNPNGSFAGTNCYGFRILDSSAAVGYPRGIKLIGCTVRDTTGGGKLYRGFQNNVPNSGNYQNELIGCTSIGHVDAAANGFDCTVANLPTSAPGGTRMTVTDSNSATFNAVPAGGGSSNVSVRYNSSTNDWRIG